MKYLLTPLTAILFLLFNVASIFILIWGAGYFYSLSWFWFVLNYAVLGLVIFTLGQGLLVTAIKFFMKFYEYKIFSRIIHSIFALGGIVLIAYFYIQHPPMMDGPEGKKFMITTMWLLAPYKAMLALTFITSIIFANSYMTVIETLRTTTIEDFYKVRLLKGITSF
jgi:hypothetical protein